MKKTIILLLLALVFTENTVAQNKYAKEMLLQIAALKVYIEEARKGYSVVKKGIQFVGAVKRGELGLHRLHYLGLEQVNPKIKKHVQVGEMIVLQLRIIKLQTRSYKKVLAIDLFHGDEIDYIQRVFEKLLSDCSITLEELAALTANSKLSLSDDERLQKLGTLYQRMQSNYRFCKVFSSEVDQLILVRTKEKQDSNTMRLWNNL